LNQGRETAIPASFQCEVGRASARGFRRAILTLSLVAPLRTLVRALAALLFGYRRKGDVTASSESLKVQEGIFVFGREVRTKTHFFEVKDLTEVTLTTPESDLLWLARLAPITLGTCLGLALVGRTAVGFAYAVELLGSAAVILTLGLTIDYLLIRSRPGEKARAKLFLVSRRGTELELTGPESELRSWVEAWMVPSPRSDSEPARPPEEELSTAP
jgi:hypothetical protein